jgi:type II secretory ATPase GspE/PulE/Tfp pilus assembly ATPase PilB-like protein
MPVTRAIRKLILDKSDSETIQECAAKEGMRTLLENGIEKVKAGITSFEELARVI